ncbi:MAG TPA: hypothetical protein VHV49_05855 [Pseudonocardiaceae bacterium]|nr:hypothetical protein [Pseudonocardiaceae bacterium]
MSDEHWLVRALLAAYPKDYRDRYGAEMLAVSHERAGGRRWPGVADVADLAGGVVRVRLSRVREAGRHERLRDGLAVAGVLAPVLMLGGLAAPVHEVAWFVWFGGLAEVPWPAAAGTAPLFAPWAVVAVLALLGRRRVAAGLAWLVVAATVAGTAAGLVFPVVALGAWLSLGLVAAIALSRASDTGWAVVGRWRLALVVGAVVSVLVVVVAGHIVRWADPLAWLVVGAAVVAVCRSAGVAGRLALLVLAAPAVSAPAVSAPAVSAAAIYLTVRLAPGAYGLPWWWLAAIFQGAPLAVAAVVAPVRSGWRGSAAG